VLPTSRLFGRISQKGPNKTDNSAAEYWPILKQKGPKNGPNFNKIVSLLLSSLSNSREMFKNIAIFPLTPTKNTVFLEPKFLQKGKLLGDQIFFLSGRIFLLDWPKNLCKELATLVPVQAGDGALDTQQHHRNTAVQHNTAQVKIFSDCW
jgi:hypothetical protein